MNASMFYIGGSKGGVGKSKVSFALIDYLISNGHKVLLLESDTANPDVYKAHLRHANEGLVCKLSNLDEAEGWIELVNFADAYPEHVMVINSAARSNKGIEQHGATLRETLGELQRELVTFWVLNRQRDSLELLRGFLNVFSDALIHACRNLHFGDAGKFVLYSESQAKQIVEKKGKTLNFPDLADRVADAVYSKRIPIWVAMKELTIGDRAELKRWRTAYGAMFGQVLGDMAAAKPDEDAAHE